MGNPKDIPTEAPVSGERGPAAIIVDTPINLMYFIALRSKRRFS